MPSSYSSHLRFELMATGENRSTWGIKANNDFSLIEQAIAGYVSIPLSDADLTLTTSNGSTDQARMALLNFTGTLTADRTITLPSVSKMYVVANNTAGGFNLGFLTSSVGSVGISVAAGMSQVIYTDGTNVYTVTAVVNKDQVGLGNVDNTADVDKPVSTAQATAIRTAIPPGTIAMWSGSGLPTGWIECNGALLSRTTYANLWTNVNNWGNPVSDAVWGGSDLLHSYRARWSTGDGSTNFRVPDLRGAFVRAWDHGFGLDTGRDLGNFQDHTNVSHSHGINDPGHTHGISQGAHTHGVGDPGHTHPYPTAPNDTGSGYTPRNGAFDTYLSTNAAYTGISIQAATIPISNVASGTGISIQNQGSSDGHPRNWSLMFIVKVT